MSNSLPRYLELVNWIKDQIRMKALVPGQKIYSEHELSRMFQLSRQTVRHAISVLEHEGIVRREQGSGTYICDTRLADLEKRSRIAVVTTYVDSYIFPKTIQGIESVLLEKGYTMQISFTNNQVEREKKILEEILERDEVAGIIMETTKSGLPNVNRALFLELISRKIPIIFINSFYPTLKIPHVSINDRMAGRKATAYLIAMGHTKIGGIFKLDDGQGHLRYAGYVDAMNTAGFPVCDTNIVWIDTEDVKHLEKSREKILERFRGCTALICYNDEVAFSLTKLFKQENIHVPEDLSLVSIDDSELAVSGEVFLSSIKHPMEKLGEKAADNLTKLMRDPNFKASFEFDIDIVKRKSVSKIQS